VSALGAPLITREAVIAETCYFLRDIDGAAATVLENVDRSIFKIPYRLTGNAGCPGRATLSWGGRGWSFRILSSDLQGSPSICCGIPERSDIAFSA